VTVAPVVRYSMIGLAVVALIAGIVFFSNLSSQVRLECSVVRVRTVATSEDTAVLIAEIRVRNPAGVPFVIRDVAVEVTGADGNPIVGDPVAEIDLDRVLDYYKEAGPRYNPTLKVKSRIDGRTTKDWTVAASFRAPEQALLQRTALKIVMEDVDGVKVAVTAPR